MIQSHLNEFQIELVNSLWTGTQTLYNVSPCLEPQPLLHTFIFALVFQPEANSSYMHTYSYIYHHVQARPKAKGLIYVNQEMNSATPPHIQIRSFVSMFTE